MLFRSFYLIISIAALGTFFAKNLARTRVGRAFIAIRDNDLAAEVMGINLLYYKLLAFFIGCFYAGIAGSLMAHYTHIAFPDAYTFMDGIWYLGMLIIGGMGSILGAILGTIAIKGLGELIMVYVPVLERALPFLSGQLTTSLVNIAFGLIIILFLVYEPRGLAHRWAIIKSSYRLMPVSY